MTQPAAKRLVTEANMLASTEAFGMGQKSRGMVCFTYDDGYNSWPTLKALADARGHRNTFFVTSNHIGVNLSNADLLAYVAAGHEIGAHSKTHAHIPAQTVANRAIEYDDPKTVLEGVLGTNTVRAWAYPFGDRSATTDLELYGRYPQIFGTGYAQPAVIPMEDRFGRYLYGRQQWLQNTHATVLDLIKLAHRNPVVVVIYCHDPGNTSGSFATDPSITQVTEAYDLCKSLGVPSVTVGEALPSGNVVRNGGFEDGLTAWQMPLGIPTGLTVESLTDTPDTSVALGGTKSLHIGATSPIGANCIIEQTIPVKPGTSWNWGARWRAANMVTGQLQFDFQRLDYSGTQIATTASTISTNSGWGRPTRAVVVEANCVAINIKFSVGTGFQGDVYLDHVDLRPTQHGLFA